MSPDHSSGFRLVTTIDDRLRSFPLRHGENVIGTLPICQVQLQLSGVSRRHAVIEARDSSLSIVDLESKNGTSVNGRPIRSSELRLGDEVELCGVSFKVDLVEAGDSDLALALTGPAVSSEMVGTTTQTRLNSSNAGLAVAEVLAAGRLIWQRLFRAQEPDFAIALEIALQAIGGEAAVWMELRQGSGERHQTVVLASHGKVDADFLTELEQAVKAGNGGDSVTAHRPRPDGGVCVLASRGGHTGPATAALLDLMLDWLLHLQGQVALPPKPVVDSDSNDLTFPRGFVRGGSPAMRSVYSQIRHLTQGDMPVLIVGDTGVGKELMARTLHLSSSRGEGPMVAINCAAIPADLLEAELFGIGRGVATGVNARSGRIAEADGGTLFLDEIGDMPAELQAKLLRVLQEQEIQPLGGRPIPVDVRIVSATHSELSAAIERGDFRQDLYYRLAGYVLRLPPLTERNEDLPVLVETFLRRFSSAIDKPLQGMTVTALQRLSTYHWPGNVRQLEHEVRRMVYLAYPGQAIDSTLLSPEIALSADAAGEGASAVGAAHSLAGLAAVRAKLPTLDLTALEKQAIEEAMASSDGTLIDAANRLGLTRDSLRRRLVRHGLRES